MKLKRKNIPDPMKFIVSEIGEDEKGKYAIMSAKNMETGEIITKKMYEDKTYDSQKDFSETVIAPETTYYVIGRRKGKKHD